MTYKEICEVMDLSQAQWNPLVRARKTLRLACPRIFLKNKTLFFFFPQVFAILSVKGSKP